MDLQCRRRSVHDFDSGFILMPAAGICDWIIPKLFYIRLRLDVNVLFVCEIKILHIFPRVERLHQFVFYNVILQLYRVRVQICKYPRRGQDRDE